MSHEFESYATTSNNYDETRAAVGVEILMGCLSTLRWPLSEVRLVDAGCGTGNYSAAVASRVGQLTCLDISPAMLARARAKLNPEVKLVLADIVDLPLQPGGTHAIMMNQVAHHFEDPGQAERFSRLEQFAHSAFRTLAPGGMLIVNTSLRPQVADGYWWADLIPHAITKIQQRYPPAHTWREMFGKAGFEPPRSFVPLDDVLQHKDYLNPEGPLQESWRNGDSTWALVTDEELTSAQVRVRTMIGDGTMAAYLEQREQLRARVGQTTFVTAIKPS